MKPNLFFQLRAIIFFLPFILIGCGLLTQQPMPIDTPTYQVVFSTQTSIAAATNAGKAAEETQAAVTSVAETQAAAAPPVIKTQWAEIGVANGTEWVEFLATMQSAQGTQEAATNEVAEICLQSKDASVEEAKGQGPLWQLISRDSIADDPTLSMFNLQKSPILDTYILLDESPIPEGEAGYAATLGQAKILACESVEQEQEFAKECPYEGGYTLRVYRTNATISLVDLVSRQTLARTTLHGTTDVCPLQWTFPPGKNYDSVTGPPPFDNDVMGWITEYWSP